MLFYWLKFDQRYLYDLIDELDKRRMQFKKLNPNEQLSIKKAIVIVSTTLNSTGLSNILLSSSRLKIVW
jgi:hypothetical protein